jgi:excisionase family DNA binding protein
MIKLYNVSEVASMLGLSTSCIYKKAEKGEIQAVKIGTALRFSDEDIHNFVSKCKRKETQASNQITSPNFFDCQDYA